MTPKETRTHTAEIKFVKSSVGLPHLEDWDIFLDDVLIGAYTPTPHDGEYAPTVWLAPENTDTGVKRLVQQAIKKNFGAHVPDSDITIEP